MRFCIIFTEKPPGKALRKTTGETAPKTATIEAHDLETAVRVASQQLLHMPGGRKVLLGVLSEDVLTMIMSGELSAAEPA